jgi:HlyD family secretion protein
MTQLLDSPATTTKPQPTETPQTPSPQPLTPKSSFPRWLLILLEPIAIAGVGIGIWYEFFRPKNNNLILFSGRIEGYETDVSTKGSDRVAEVTVREGATVTKGQLLIRLEDDELQSELAVAKSQVEAAKQREASALLQISVLESQVADTRLTLKQSEGDTSGKVTEARALVAMAQSALKQEQARVGEAKALLEQARVDRDRFMSLASQGAESQQRSDLAQTTFNVAQAALQSCQAAVKVQN